MSNPETDEIDETLVRRPMDYDRMSIEELCKPVSGRVLPASCVYTISGRKMTPREAVFADRRASNAVARAKG